MSQSRTGRTSDRRRNASPSTPLRLDLLVNPFGASLRVVEAIASRDDLHLPAGDRLKQLRSRIGEMHGIPESWIAPANGITDLIHGVLRLADGPLALFSPTDDEHRRLGSYCGLEVIDLGRSNRFEVNLNPAGLMLRADGLALIQSPNDPTGTILGVQDAVRLSRKSRLLVIDERHAAYSPRTLVPLVREFDNVVVLRTLETWAGLGGFPFAYAVAPAKVADRISDALLRQEISAASVIAAEATLDDLPWIQATVDRVREEKSRLYRTLRKLNMLETFPSWANFIMVRIERGAADDYHRELLRRDIHVHRPVVPILNDCFRISATTPDSTAALKSALIDVAAKL